MTESENHLSFLKNNWLIIASISLAWLVLVLVSLYCRPYIPIDETRYVSVAWEMWLNQHFFVPTLNALPYPAKPPLLFWLILAGWHIFGVNEWWPRVIPALFAYVNAWMVFAIASQLWPQQTQLRISGWLILLGALPWCLYSNLLLFDIVLTFFVLLALYGLLINYFKQQTLAWLLFVLGICGGLLTKGPVALIFIDVPALLLPWLLPKTNHQKPRYYYSSILISNMLGIALALCWAIPAAIQAGPDYTHAIFISQSLGRITSLHIHMYSHGHSFWWYLYFVPFYLAPWIIYPPLWRGSKQYFKQANLPVRFLISSCLTIFIFMSIMHGKQIHYLLPLLPLCALILAYIISINTKILSYDLWPFSICIILIGIGLWAVPILAVTNSTASFFAHFTPLSAIIMSAFGILLLFLRPKQNINAQLYIGLNTIIFFILFNLLVMRNLYSFYDIKAIADYVQKLQQRNPVVTIGHYYDQYQFLGRLSKPIPSVKIRNLYYWSLQNPHGWVMISQKYLSRFSIEPTILFFYQSKMIALFPASSIARPGVIILKSNPLFFNSYLQESHFPFK